MPFKKADKTEDYHKQFAENIIAQMEAGTAPWQKPWKPGEQRAPENFATGGRYRGGNALYLTVAGEARGFGDNRWATYRQIANAGGHVRKGEHGEKVLFFDQAKSQLVTDQDGKPKLDEQGNKQYETLERARPYWRTYTVFNVEQTEGLKLDRPDKPRQEWQAHEAAEAVIQESGVTVKHANGDRAYYNMPRDQVVLPDRAQFPTADAYYQTALHELGHATGHESRMNRDTLKEGVTDGFGSEAYAKEELRAEISAMMTGEKVGVGHQPQHGAAYVKSWVKALQDDPREIHRAAADAERISDYLIEPAKERIAGIEQKAEKGLTAGNGHERTPPAAPAHVPAQPQPAPMERTLSIGR